MINDKIAAAKQAKRQHIFKTLLLVLLISVAGLALIIWASMPKSFDNTAEEAAPEAETTTGAVSATDEALLRQSYIDAFAVFENELRPQLAKIDLPRWDKARADNLQALEAQALRQFSAGDYGKAYASIQQLTEQAQNTIADSKTAFDAALQAAQNAFDNNDYAPAKAAIDKALMLDNSSSAAQKLSERVDQLPEIADLVVKINTANAENNRQLELDLIKQLLTFTPEREALKQRAQQLTNALNTRQFQRQITQGNQALENANLSAAQTALAAAKRIYPDRPEVRDLANAIQIAQENQQISQLQASVASAESADNWVDVKTSLTKIQSLRPDDKAITEKLAVASDIVNLQNQLDKTLASPYRLADDAAGNNARELASAATQYQSQSASLAAKTRELKQVLTAINQPVDVNIRSDNQTHIVVRGVGIVGTTAAKTIQLKPGNYTFEGKRAGYRSMLKEVEVPLDQTAVTVTLICDEPV